jgi:tripartite-type tricarboxylate transporter receptor subunit TctC
MALVTRKDFPASNLQEFIAYAKANAVKLHYGTAGVGSTTSRVRAAQSSRWSSR